MGLSSQWNFGRKTQICPRTWIFCLRSNIWSRKSSCLLRSRAMQQLLFLNGQTGEHFTCILWMSNPHSSSVCCRPFGTPALVVIFCGFPWDSTLGLFIGITVSFCFLCFPPLLLFISNAWRASGPSEVCTDEWSNKKSVMHLGCTSSKIAITQSTCTRSCIWSYHRSLPVPRYIMHWASFTTTPSWLQTIRRPFSFLTKSETWISRPCPFFISLCFPCRLLFKCEWK